MSQFLVKVFAILGLTCLNLVYFSVNSIVTFYSVITQFALTKKQLVLTKEWLTFTKEWFMHTLRSLKTLLLIFSVYTWLNLTNCWLICTTYLFKPWFVFMWGYHTCFGKDLLISNWTWLKIDVSTIFHFLLPILSTDVLSYYFSAYFLWVLTYLRLQHWAKS